MDRFQLMVDILDRLVFVLLDHFLMFYIDLMVGVLVGILVSGFDVGDLEL